MENNYNENELYHYGVLGMKWGVRRAQRKSASSDKLRKKALSLDKKAANLNKKSEKAHAKIDLERSNKAATKAANFRKKAAKLEKRVLKTDGEFEQALLKRRVEKYKYKSANATRKANRLSKQTGYGAKAMKYSIKSDKVAAKAAKARMKIANNDAYVSRMKRKASSIPKSERSDGYAFVNEFLNG